MFFTYHSAGPRRPLPERLHDGPVAVQGDRDQGEDGRVHAHVLIKKQIFFVRESQCFSLEKCTYGEEGTEFAHHSREVPPLEEGGLRGE